MGNVKRVRRRGTPVSERTTKLFEALALIATKEGKNRGVAGHIKCPMCGGKLYYTIARVNGHVWGKCETESCLSWIQ